MEDPKDPKLQAPDEPASANPLDQKQQDEKESQLLDNIIAAGEKTEDEQVLDEAPQIDEDLLEEVEPEPSLLLLVLKVLTVVFLILGIGVFVFFKSQVANTFDFLNSVNLRLPNASKQLSSTNQEILHFKTQLNFYRYILAKAYLDAFSYYGDIYIHNYEVANSQTASKVDKKNAKDILPELKKRLAIAFNGAKDKLIHNAYVNYTELDEIFEDKENPDSKYQAQFNQMLIDKLKEQAEKLADTSDRAAFREYLNYSSSIHLVNNKTLRDILLQTNFAYDADKDVDTLSNREVYVLVKDVNLQVVNALSTIQQIKENRIKWSDIIDEIDVRTAVVDNNYKNDVFDEFGGIKYLSYIFDTETKSLIISGEIKRYDTTNFTMITNLIEELNSSGFFGDAEMRSFSKSGSLEEGYKSSVKLSLNLKDYVLLEEEEDTTKPNPL